MIKDAQTTKAHPISMLATVIATMRPPFLILTPACLLLAFSLVYQNTGGLQWHVVALVSVGAVCAHIAVNMLNEHSDFHSGLDFMTKRTPFSGGSGALIKQPKAQKLVLLIAYINLLICCAVGLYFTFTMGFELLGIGIVGILIIVSYTKWINRLPFLCWLTPGFAFGVLLINGSYFVLTKTFQLDVILISLLPFFLINNLLLLNQFPDLKADREHGRNHILIKYGVSKGVITYITGSTLCDHASSLSLSSIFAAY